jgi:beta-galactosidase
MIPDQPRPVREQSSLWFGGDYNPEQWPRSVWQEDLAALSTLGVNTVTLPVFAWSSLQPAKDSFNFGWLDEVLSLLDGRGIGVILATPTAAQPAWMSAAYPEVLPVDAWGHRRRHGGRVNYCPTSSAYRDGSAQIAKVLAERYADFAGLRMWHVNNEYGPTCYCEGCRDEFQRWLIERHGDLETLNQAWGTDFWGNRLQDWSEIEFPSHLNAMDNPPEGWVRFSPNPGLVLDHSRFVSSILLSCYLAEKSILREFTPDVPITTNFHGPVQTVDWHEWGPHLDVVSWDSYPPPDSHWTRAAFGHDLARSAGPLAEFLLMEMSPGPVNWQPIASLKPPGTMRLQAFQAIARGSRGALFFQVRQSRSGAELNHSALIPRHGRLDTRTGEELVALGQDLALVGVPPDTHQLVTRAALVFDWPSWWAHHATPGLDQQSRYLDTARSFHRVLSERGLVVDVVGRMTDWDRYDLVIAPILYVVDAELAGRLKTYVAAGGTLITTAGSGIADPHGSVHAGGSEPTWRELVGVWVEETDVQPPDVVNAVRFDDGLEVAASSVFEILRVEGAEVLARFQDRFYRDSPALTTNRVGDGLVMYLASPAPELFAAALERFVGGTSEAPVPEGVEVVAWDGEAGRLVFGLNHGTGRAELSLPSGSWTDVLTGALLEGKHLLEPGGLVVARSSQ